MIASQIAQHATAVALGRQGVLLLGESGSGKSDLALRLIDRGGTLVADDQVMLRVLENQLVASSPPRIAGLLEARGAGILRVPYRDNVALSLAVELRDRQDIQRLPEPEWYECLGIHLPLVRLHAFDLSTPVKIEWLLEAQNRSQAAISLLSGAFGG